jgi:hypothetical protein
MRTVFGIDCSTLFLVKLFRLWHPRSDIGYRLPTERTNDFGSSANTIRYIDLTQPPVEFFRSPISDVHDRLINQMLSMRLMSPGQPDQFSPKDRWLLEHLSFQWVEVMDRFGPKIDKWLPSSGPFTLICSRFSFPLGLHISQVFSQFLDLEVAVDVLASNGPLPLCDHVVLWPRHEEIDFFPDTNSNTLEVVSDYFNIPSNSRFGFILHLVPFYLLIDRSLEGSSRSVRGEPLALAHRLSGHRLIGVSNHS